MSKTRKGLAVCAAAIALTSLSVSERGDAANAVQTTKDDCRSAWAILMSSHPSVHAGFPHVEYKEAILSVVRNHPHWTVAEYEANYSQKFSLQTFDTRFHEGGTSYVAHCGHGATCNELARAVLKQYPELGSPAVYCTVEPPHILENPQSF